MVILNSTPGVKKKYVDAEIKKVNDVIGAGISDSTLTEEITKLKVAVGDNADGLASKVTTLESDVDTLKTSVGTTLPGLITAARTKAEQGVEDAAAAQSAAEAAQSKANVNADAISTINSTLDGLATTYLGINAEAKSAAKLSTNAGGENTPVYFANGVPVALGFTIATSVPAGAVFTDTVTTVRGNDGAGNVITDITAANGQITVSKGTVATTKEIGDLQTAVQTAQSDADDAQADATQALADAATAQEAAEAAQTTADNAKSAAEANTSAISSLKDGSTETIKSLDTKIGQNTTNIGQNTSSITELQSSVASNTSNISTLTGTTIPNAKTEAISEAKGYTDTKISSLKSELEGKITSEVSSVYKAKGTLHTLDGVPGVVGDVYNVDQPYDGHPAGTNWVYTDEGWDALAGIADLSAYATREAINTALGNIENDITSVDGEIDTLFKTRAKNPVKGEFTASSALSGSCSISWSTTFTPGTDDTFIIQYTNAESAYEAGIEVISISGSTMEYTMDYEGYSVGGYVVCIPAGSDADHTTGHTPGAGTTVGDGASEPSTANILGRQF